MYIYEWTRRRRSFIGNNNIFRKFVTSASRYETHAYRWVRTVFFFFFVQKNIYMSGLGGDVVLLVTIT
jgi:hypothetical protein